MIKIALLILTLATLRQAIIASIKQTSTEDNRFAYVLLPTLTMWLMALEVI